MIIHPILSPMITFQYFPSLLIKKIGSFGFEHSPLEFTSFDHHAEPAAERKPPPPQSAERKPPPPYLLSHRSKDNISHRYKTGYLFALSRFIAANWGSFSFSNSNFSQISGIIQPTLSPTSTCQNELFSLCKRRIGSPKTV